MAEKPGYAKKIAKFFPNLTWFLGSIDPEADAYASFVSWCVCVCHSVPKMAEVLVNDFYILALTRQRSKFCNGRIWTHPFLGTCSELNRKWHMSGMTTKAGQPVPQEVRATR